MSTAGDTIRKINIEIAESPLTRQLGLMYREDMNDDRGMLFIFPTQHEQAFWMKNTYISLDMIFVNNLLEIVTIHEKAIPFSQDPYYSYDPAIYVIEVVAGFTQKYGITVGDKVSWKRTYSESP